MAAAEAVVASRSRDQETTTARNGGHSAVEQLALPLDEPSPADMARGVIPLAPRREKPDPVTAPTRQDNPSHDTDAPASGALWDPFPGRFTKIPLAIASHYTSELGPTKTQILEAMHNLIYGYRAMNHLQAAVADPHNADGHYQLGRLLLKLGRKEEVREHLALFERLREP